MSSHGMTRKAAALDNLRQRELSCSNAITESLRKRDRARLALQSAMRDQEKTERKAEKKTGLARFRSNEKDAAAAEAKVHKAASAQTASIEELATRPLLIDMSKISVTKVQTKLMNVECGERRPPKM